MDETNDNKILEELSSVNKDEDIIQADDVDVIAVDDDGHNIEQAAVHEKKKTKSAKLIIIAVCCVLIVGLSAICIKQYTDRKETENVITMIDQLVKADNLNQSLLKEINVEYNELSENQKSHVANYQDRLNYVSTKETQAVINKITQLGQSDKFNRPLLDEIEAAYNELSSEQKKSVTNYQDWADYVNYHNTRYKYLNTAKVMLDQCDKNMEYIESQAKDSLIVLPVVLDNLSNSEIENNYKYLNDNMRVAFNDGYITGKGDSGRLNDVNIMTNIYMTYELYKKVYDMINAFEYDYISFDTWRQYYNSYSKSAADSLNSLLTEYVT